jgi:hypothetical protein
VHGQPRHWPLGPARPVGAPFGWLGNSGPWPEMGGWKGGALLRKQGADPARAPPEAQLAGSCCGTGAPRAAGAVGTAGGLPWGGPHQRHLTSGDEPATLLASCLGKAAWTLRHYAGAGAAARPGLCFRPGSAPPLKEEGFRNSRLSRGISGCLYLCWQDWVKGRKTGRRAAAQDLQS